MYIRWGRTECPTGATVLYDGFVSGSFYYQPGGMSNLLCLPNEPDYVQTEQCQEYSTLYSTEYETHDQVFSRETHQYDAVCVFCLALEKNSIVMMPGKVSCPNSLQTEYSGYLMSTKYSHDHPTDAICVDGNAEVFLGSDQDTNGATLYFAVADCNHSFLPCGPYKHLVPISCAVCSY